MTDAKPRSLYLVRHAKSTWDDPELHDFERPLNPRGRRDAPRMAAHCRALVQEAGEHPLLLSSPAVRAITTARHFAAELAIDPRAMRVDARIYEATPGDWLEVLCEQDEAVQSLIAVGHNPGISGIAAWLCEPLHDVELPTAAVVALSLPALPWRALARHCAECRSVTRPRDL